MKTYPEQWKKFLKNVGFPVAGLGKLRHLPASCIRYFDKINISFVRMK